MTGSEDNDVVDIECSRGRLGAIQAQLVNGVAQVALTSAAETCISKITATGDSLVPDDIDIQFAPIS